MKVSRRNFITKSIVGSAAVGLGSAVGAETCGTASSAPAAAACGTASAAPVVAACGISCSACPLLKSGKCKGCGAGNAVSSEMVAAKSCPVLTCANMKKIAFCGTECKMYAKCGKLVGRPYAKEFLDMIGSKLD